MMACASAEVLRRLLEGTLATLEVAALRQHLLACPSCLAILDQLSDHSQLRELAGSCPSLETVAGENAPLAGMLAALRDMPPFDTFPSDPPERVRPPSSFLGPPLHPGDLGSLDGYRVLSELGRGGMGIVFKAIDPALQRTVALKVLPPERSDAAARERFVREARAAAGFNHDHIVPLHAVVNPDQGPPYLVLQYVDGKTLGQRIRAEKRLPPPEAARIALQVADGLVAAHGAGLVHRDIKPGNIILDAAQDRARIMDFGLVCLRERSGGTTQEGTLVGTPEYMSPEQVVSPQRIDERTDIYSLGVTLYESLTGETPFRGDLHGVLRQILNDEPAPPRRWSDKIPADLQTICLKAMNKEPGRRYHSASELRDDLARWTRGEPVLARPAGAGERLVRWCRRKPLVASLTAALVLVFVGGFGGVLWQLLRVEQQRAEADRARELADEQRLRAQRHFDKAFTVVDRLLLRVGDKQLAHVPYMDEERRRLLEDALEFYQGFLNESSTDPAIRRETALAHGKAAAIYALLGRDETAEGAWRAALDLQETLVRDFPQTIDYRVERAATLRELGRHYFRSTRMPEARASLTQALEVLDGLVRGHPEHRAARRDKVLCYHYLGELCRLTRRPGDAEQALSQAVSLGQELIAEDPGDVEAQAHLGRALVALGVYYRADPKRLSQAEASYLAAGVLWEQLIRQDPKNPTYREAAASVQNNLGILYSRMDRPADAEKAHLQCAEVQRQLAEDHPDVLDYQVILAKSCNNLGLFYYDSDQVSKAEGPYREALELYDELARRYPRRVECMFLYAGTIGNWARWLNKMERQEEALKWLDKAFQAYDKVLRAEPRHTEAKLALHNAHYTKGLALLHLGRTAEAAEHWRRVVELGEGEIHESYRISRPRALGYLGDHRRAMAEVEILLAEGQTRAWVLDALATACCLAHTAVQKDDKLSAAERAVLAEKYARRAVGLIDQALSAGLVKSTKDLDKLRTSKSFEPLRPRLDFQNLLRAMEQKLAQSSDGYQTQKESYQFHK